MRPTTTKVINSTIALSAIVIMIWGFGIMMTETSNFVLGAAMVGIGAVIAKLIDKYVEGEDRV